MKQSGLWLSALCLFASLGLAGCNNQGGKIQMHGHIESMQVDGHTCWLFIDDEHQSYEVITPSREVLRDGLKMFIRAVPIERHTLCGFPTVIDILEYRPDGVADDYHAGGPRDM